MHRAVHRRRSQPGPPPHAIRAGRQAPASVHRAGSGGARRTRTRVAAMCQGWTDPATGTSRRPWSALDVTFAGQARRSRRTVSCGPLGLTPLHPRRHPVPRASQLRPGKLAKGVLDRLGGQAAARACWRTPGGRPRAAHRRGWARIDHDPAVGGRAGGAQQQGSSIGQVTDLDHLTLRRLLWLASPPFCAASRPALGGTRRAGCRPARLVKGPMMARPPAPVTGRRGPVWAPGFLVCWRPVSFFWLCWTCSAPVFKRRLERCAVRGAGVLDGPGQPRHSPWPLLRRPGSLGSPRRARRPSPAQRGDADDRGRRRPASSSDTRRPEASWWTMWPSTGRSSNARAARWRRPGGLMTGPPRAEKKMCSGTRG